MESVHKRALGLLSVWVEEIEEACLNAHVLQRPTTYNLHHPGYVLSWYILY
jgi:hypothetical protein